MIGHTSCRQRKMLAIFQLEEKGQRRLRTELKKERTRVEPMLPRVKSIRNKIITLYCKRVGIAGTA